MKNFLYLSIISLLFTACGGGGGDDSDPIVNPPAANTAPTTPVITAPADNKLCLNNLVSFQWNESTDSQKDAINYQIQVAKDNTFSQIVTTIDYASNLTNIVLEKNTAYYWRVKATDSKGLSSPYTITYKFYTAGEAVINHLPFSPTLVKPAINSVLTTTTATLEWTASDVDASDVLTYDVLFGTVNPPTEKIGNNLAVTTANISLEPTKQYFWRVVVKDNKGGETQGQVWKFKSN